jgi:hypothetical protein
VLQQNAQQFRSAITRATENRDLNHDLECAGRDGALAMYLIRVIRENFRVHPKRRRRCALPAHSKVRG